MSASFLAGTWVLDKGASELSQAQPLHWVQRVEVEGPHIRIQEEITHANGTTMVGVDAKADGAFYPVIGSPVADEILRGCSLKLTRAIAVECRRKYYECESDPILSGELNGFFKHPSEAVGCEKVNDDRSEKVRLFKVQKMSSAGHNSPGSSRNGHDKRP
jgi:hypothetical protein